MFIPPKHIREKVMSETEDGLVLVIYLNSLRRRKRACLTQAGEKKFVFMYVPTELLQAPAVIKFLQLIQRVKHMTAENDLVAKVFSAWLERSVSLEPYTLNLL